MILLGVGAEMLARLMRADQGPGPDTAWLLTGPSELAVEPCEADAQQTDLRDDWPLAAE